jgi:hypothetical protein
MKEALSSPETSVITKATQHNIPEDATTPLFNYAVNDDDDDDDDDDALCCFSEHIYVSIRRCHGNAGHLQLADDSEQ